MSSSTDPYLPQEKHLYLTWSILDEMRACPPDVLVVQSHHTLVDRDIDLIVDLSQRFAVGQRLVSMTTST